VAPREICACGEPQRPRDPLPQPSQFPTPSPNSQDVDSLQSLGSWKLGVGRCHLSASSLSAASQSAGESMLSDSRASISSGPTVLPVHPPNRSIVARPERVDRAIARVGGACVLAADHARAFRQKRLESVLRRCASRNQATDGEESRQPSRPNPPFVSRSVVTAARMWSGCLSGDVGWSRTIMSGDQPSRASDSSAC
jgi:hypothetical protein